MINLPPDRQPNREKVDASSGGHTFDVIVVGAGPAGSTIAWKLAKQGVDVLLIDKAQFPRDKVCGDFVEPRGLRTLDMMGCLRQLEETNPLPITSVSMYLQSQLRYHGKIPFYGHHQDLPPHGYIISRYDLDYHMLISAESAGATILQQTSVVAVHLEPERVVVEVETDGRRTPLYGRLIVGADGTRSIVARSVGLYADDPRYMAVSKRCYVDKVDVCDGEAAFYFDRETFPGYAWMFPMSATRANVGVGILAEARVRYGLRVPALLDRFIAQLRSARPGFENLEIVDRPIGGIVKTYGGAGDNYFERGILIGDAGCFVDPITGEGIAPAMESALLGANVLCGALEQGRFDASYLSAYKVAYRAHFDPAMNMLNLVATIMRNRHFAGNWLRSVSEGCELAQKDPGFARKAGGMFGGMEVLPVQVAMAVWQKSIGILGKRGIDASMKLLQGEIKPSLSIFQEGLDWQVSWWKSISADPAWHARWASDVLKGWVKVAGSISAHDPRTGIIGE